MWYSCGTWPLNIADRASLYAEVRPILAPGGRFATYDVVLCDGNEADRDPAALNIATKRSSDRSRSQVKLPEAASSHCAG
jgi:hypothetical protein